MELPGKFVDLSYEGKTSPVGLEDDRGLPFQ